MDIKGGQKIVNEAHKIAKESTKRSDEIGDFLRRVLTGPISDKEYKSRMKLFAESFKREAAAVDGLLKEAKKLAEERG
jgi:hypothetical protein